MLVSHLPRTHRERTPMGPDVVRHILHLFLYLSEAHPELVGYLLNSFELHPRSAKTLTLMGQGSSMPHSVAQDPTATYTFGKTLCHVMSWRQNTPAYCHQPDRLTPP
jgi:hypothetical protein